MATAAKKVVRMECEDGVYEGDVVDDVPHGRGTFWYNSGDIYEGQWHYNAQQGRGKYTWADGETYEGEFHDNLRHGFGVTVNATSKYSGEYVENQRRGKGIEETPNSTYDGEWLDDVRHGKGKITYDDGSYYDGNWFQDKRSGLGYLRMTDGNVYEGEFLNDLPHGKGEYRWAEGGSFVGYFKEGKRHGEGVERLANGDWLAGNWINGVHDGKQKRHRRGEEVIKVFNNTITSQTASSPTLPPDPPAPPVPTVRGTPSGAPQVVTPAPQATVTKPAPPTSPSTVRNNNNSNSGSSATLGVPASTVSGSPSTPRAPGTAFGVSASDTKFEELAKGAVLGRLLGKGSFGSVFEAMLPNGKVVALKIIELGSLQNSEAEMNALTNEILLLSKLKHRNIVRLEGCVEDKQNNKMCIYMEYVAGGTLTSFMKKFSKISPDIIRMWTVQILAGVNYLHENNVIHRDIKGDNILVGNDGIVKLADFGCSREINAVCSKTHGCRSMVGTPYWMAPEVIKDDSNGYGPKADVWSVGCTIVEMLTGKPPWPEFSSMWGAIYHIANSTGLPSEIPKDLPPEIMDFLLQTFERDPMKRASARELLQHQWLRDLSVQYDY